MREVLREPQHPYTRGLLASLPGATHGQPLRPIAGSVPRLGSFPGGCTFHPRCPNRFTPCDAAIPGAFHTGPGRTVRCFLHDDHAAR